VFFIDSWPYPNHREVWDWIEDTFDVDEDFVLAGRQTTRRRLDRLTMSRGQSSVLERGSVQIRDHELADTSVNTALGYTSMVGMMLAEELANAEEQVGTLDRTSESRSDYLLDCRSAGSCTGGGALCRSFQRSLSFIGREGVRARDIPAVDHGEARHLACRRG